MKIEGKKYLQQNTYDKMMIDLSGNRRIKLTSDFKLKTIPGNKNIDDSEYKKGGLDRDTQDEIILKLIDHYLEYAFINEIKNYEHVPYYKGFYSVVYSDDRMLMLRFKKSELGNEINKKIIDKYYYNRSKYCFNKENEIKEITCSFSEDGMTSFKDGVITFPLIYNKSYSFHPKDEKFLKELLLDRFDGENYACINTFVKKYEEGYFLYEEKRLVCGDFKTVINNITELWIRPIIDEYNEELYKIKERQLVFK